MPDAAAILEAWRNPEPPYRGLRSPGLARLAVGVERYSIAGGGSCAVPLQAGDEWILVDEQGLQLAELTFIDASGKAQPASVSGTKTASGAEPTLLRNFIARSSQQDQLLTQLLQRLNCAPADIKVSTVCDASAGHAWHCQVEQEGTLVVMSASSGMQPFEQQPATPLTLYVWRNQLDTRPSLSAPAPLADVLNDHNIQPGQAYAYEVKTGQYIQILDVQGRECSDFQAFALADLSCGADAGIDPTTTRSMVGAAYPAPGLFAKYWSVNQRALLEIVQDTCGRHDSFGLACTARYYEDLGYPGHINCSDNINRALAGFGLHPRAGWPAINFFYNTQLSAANVIFLDEPWSRPGDYVLLRALTDLLCVSTACPCDVDAANGWQPTDIQVRVYDRQLPFRRSIAYRKHPEADMQPTQYSAFHECFSEHTRDMVEYKGYWLPNQTRAGAIEEYWACREQVAVMDLSALRKYEVTGPDAEALLDLCLTRNIKKLSVGQVVYTAMCYEHGGMVDDGTVFRLGENNFRWVCGVDTSAAIMREQAKQHRLQAWVRDATEQLCNIALQGPYARALLEQVVWTADAQPSIAELGWFRFCIARLNDYQGAALVISRTGYTGELGYEIFCHPKDAKPLFDMIWKAGQAYGIKPLGLKALDMLRIEAGLAFAGQEFCDQTDPFEAGIGFTVALNKNSDFIGKAALERRQANPARKLVGLVLDGGDVPASGDCVHIGRAQVGTITSAVKSPVLEQVIALCRIDVHHAAVGTQVEVGQLDGQQKRLAAAVVAFPHFDPSKQRVKGHYQ